jgi:hypothetical protein
MGRLGKVRSLRESRRSIAIAQARRGGCRDIRLYGRGNGRCVGAGGAEELSHP